MTRLLASLALASGMVVGLGQTPASAQTGPSQPLVTVVDFVVNSVDVEDGQLIANATATLNVVGQRTITQAVRIPINIEDAECDILNLSLGPIDLDLLGLVVELDDCEGGPVTVDITAVPGGGLLGDLLCAIAGLLDGGLDLGAILEGLTEEQLGSLTGAIQDALNGVFAVLLEEGTVITGQQMSSQDGRCDILTLAIPEGLELDLLGLNVETSGICLDVYAQEGPGNLLGNLLCSLTDLLNNPGNTGRAELVLVRNILRVLDRLGL